MANDGIVDTANNAGDLSTLVNDLQEATANQPAPDGDPATQTTETSTDSRPDWIDEKFWTGDVSESASKQHQSYLNLQTAYGRMANDLGNQRKLTDRLLDLKRDTDLNRNTPEPVQVEGADLLDKPNETLDRFLEPRLKETTQQLQDRLAGIEAALAQQAFVSQHPDYNEIANDPQFGNWANATPYRAAAAQRAISGDYDAANELLTEYKLQRQTGNQQASNADAGNVGNAPSGDDVNGARAASLESTASGQSTASGKVYSRSDLIRLKLEQPAVYEDLKFQDEIMRAYAEGRVK